MTRTFPFLGVEVMEINVPIVIGSIPPKRIRHRASISEHFFGNHSSGWAASRLLPSDRIFSEDSFPDDLRGPTTVMFLQVNEWIKPNNLVDGPFLRTAKKGKSNWPKCSRTIFATKSMYILLDFLRKIMFFHFLLFSKFQLLYTNKYPFYLNLPTSSKQSRKLSVLAMAIRAENSFSNAVNREMRESCKFF